MNPEYFDIKNLKMFGMWPHQNYISRGISPYIKRIRKNEVSVLLVGDNKGEQAVDMLDLCGNKIGEIQSLINTDDDLIKALYKTNTKDLDKIREVTLITKNNEFDVVGMDEHSCDADFLAFVYDYTPSGAIFCGNGHETNKVKEALTNFRRKCKIGTPIQIANRSIWFWYKR